MDNELFELCKDVYERTGWECYESGTPTSRRDASSIKYTSDYLLEKLPKQMDGGDHPEQATWLSLRMVCDSTYGFGFYYERTDLDAHADTPLKALLKLVIALDDAKELK